MFVTKKITRLGPMSAQVCFPVHGDISKSVEDFILFEINDGWKNHNQKVFTTYIMIETSYAGCVKCSRDGENVTIRVKTYNAVADDTAKVMNTVSENLGFNVEASFKPSDPNAPEFVREIVKAWIDDQYIVKSDSDLFSLQSELEEIESSEDPSKVGEMTSLSIISDFGDFSKQFIDDSERIATIQEVLPFACRTVTYLDKNLIPYIAVKFQLGGGVMYRCISPVIYGNEKVVKPSLWRRVFAWTDSPGKGKSCPKKTQSFLDAIIKSTNRQGCVQVFPSPQKGS